MGADSKGKQELPPALFDRASLYCDLPTQSRVIGELQRVDSCTEVHAIGHVLHGNQSGRQREDEITIFDSSGISLQDLFVAQRLARAASN